MNASIAAQGVWGLVFQSDFVSKMVLLTLFLMSVASWAIALYKVIVFRIKQQQCKALIRDIKACATLAEVTHLAQQHAKTLPGYVLIELLTHVKQSGEHHANEMLQIYADQILDEVMYEEEALTPVLAVTSAVATLLGLFGTVWGLVHSFIRISEKQSADIVTVAPGIAEALITTVAGLLVAVPALVFLHYVSSQTRELEHYLAMLCDKVGNIARKSLVKPTSKSASKSVDQSVDHDQSSLS